jgi:hypothetical protein
MKFLFLFLIKTSMKLIERKIGYLRIRFLKVFFLIIISVSNLYQYLEKKNSSHNSSVYKNKKRENIGILLIHSSYPVLYLYASAYKRTRWERTITSFSVCRRYNPYRNVARAFPAFLFLSFQ